MAELRELAEDMSMSMLGRHYDPSDNDSDEVRRLRELIIETVTRVLTRTHELECDKMTLQRLGGQVNQAIAQQELGSSRLRGMQPYLIMIDTAGTLGLPQMSSPTLGMQ